MTPTADDLLRSIVTGMHKLVAPATLPDPLLDDICALSDAMHGIIEGEAMDACGIRCDVCHRTVSQAKTVFVCDDCKDKAAPRWIPVTERLPEENDAVLVVWKDGDIGLAFMHKDDWDYATHWMPLPQPPEVKG